MKTIGIVAGGAPEAAAVLSAAIWQKDPRASILSERVAFSEGSELRDAKIAAFCAAEELFDKGAAVVAFTDPAVQPFSGELRAECRARLVFPDSGFGIHSAVPVNRYVDRILAQSEAPLRKPFKIGIIGGLGPAATVDLYDKITRATPARTDQEHLRVVIEQNPQTPDRTACLLNGGVDPTLALFNSALRLQKDGCDALLIPCNTAHAFIPAMERHLAIPFINMQESALNEIRDRLGDRARIGLLATTGTVSTGIYAKKAQAMGLPMFVPDDAGQALVMDAIYGPQGAKAGCTDGHCRDVLLEAAAGLVRDHGCNVLILGCTELPLILAEGEAQVAGAQVLFVDPTAALARCAVALAQAENAAR